MLDDSTKTVELTVNPISGKYVPCSSFNTLIRDETEGVFGLRAMSRIIDPKLGYGHISHYFIVPIYCA